MTSKILNIVTASNGKKFQRTTKIARFTWAFIYLNSTTYTEVTWFGKKILAKGYDGANFYETKAEAEAELARKQNLGGNYEIAPVVRSVK